MLEGTLEEMLDLEESELGEDNLKEERGNYTISDREKRQAEFPGAPEQDNSKFVFFISDLCSVNDQLLQTLKVWCLWVQGRGYLPLLGQQQQRQGAGHPQQQGVRAGDTSGDLLVSDWG